MAGTTVCGISTGEVGHIVSQPKKMATPVASVVELCQGTDTVNLFGTIKYIKGNDPSTVVPVGEGQEPKDEEQAPGSKVKEIG